MKRQTLRKLVRPAKPLLAKTLWRVGTVRTILLGPCRGLRYRIFPGMGLSPIYGGWEEDAQNLMKKHIKPQDVVYDIGANYGIHTLLFARLVGQPGHVYAFEPVPDIHAELGVNVGLNNFHNVTTLKMAVSEHAGPAFFSRGHHVGAGHLAEAANEQDLLNVETATLDDFVFEKGNRPPNFMKLDIEGGEGSALRGAMRVLKEHRPIVLVDLHTPEQDLAVGRVFSEAHYEAFRTEDGEKVQDLSRGWPAPEGLWGQVIAFPKN
ncbi:MAG TPA: FkbM family methyltransferase [Pyrinomonadaceae bacterium]|nr:FkbM family methyltransferase [Pyrinomonadaceae bacterium]